eukprot:9440423-Alexandrium_andersonii.AAC.1
MGAPRGHTKVAWVYGHAKADPAGLECDRRSFAGNSCQCEVVAWPIDHVVYQQVFAQRIPDPAWLRASSMSRATGE